MKLAEHERRARQALAQAGVDSPALCGRLLVQHASGLDRIAYILAADKELNPESAKLLEALLGRRASGEPLAYILGKREFYGREFLVSRKTLIPRPETELLVELALGLPIEKATFMDLCSGSGCIGLSLLSERPDWHGLLADADPDTLAVAAKNAAMLGCEASFLVADMSKPPFAACSFDFMVCNPPYIARSEIGDVMQETLAWEPHFALFSDMDGLWHIQAAIEAASFCLKPGGHILLEHGYRQKEAVLRLLKAAGFVSINDYQDLAGLPRCATARKRRD